MADMKVGAKDLETIHKEKNYDLLYDEDLEETFVLATVQAQEGSEELEVNLST